MPLLTRVRNPDKPGKSPVQKRIGLGGRNLIQPLQLRTPHSNLAQAPDWLEDHNWAMAGKALKTCHVTAMQNSFIYDHLAVYMSLG